MIERMVLMLVPAFFIVSFAGMAVGCWGLFTKVGQPNWAALVPGYNLFLLVRIAGLSEWWGLLLFIPAVNMVFWFYLCDQLALKFDRGIGTSLGLICFGFVFFPLLGFGPAAYEDVIGRKPSDEDEDDHRRWRHRDEDDRPRRRLDQETADRSRWQPRPREAEETHPQSEPEGGYSLAKDDEPRSPAGRGEPAERMDDGPHSRNRRDKEETQSLRTPRRRRDDESDEPRQPRRRKRKSLSVNDMDMRVKILLMGGLVGLVLVIGGIWYLVRTVRRAPFRPHIATYTAAPAGVAPPGTKVRKIVIVDVADGDVDSLHFDLSNDLRATSPEEVTTIVQVRWNKQQVGTYSSGGAAYQWSGDVTVIDLKTKGRMGGQHFVGSQPPDSFHGRQFESRSGDKPNDAILNYLKSFPR